MNLPEAITIREVGPRDGLQNEDPVFIGDRVRLIDSLSDTGLRYIEVTSFVRPDLVPQMAGAEEVWDSVDKRPGVVYSALALNTRGAERALDAGCRAIQFVLSASETHNRRNAGRSREESLSELEKVVGIATSYQAAVDCTISTAWGCPYEGGVSVGEVARLAKAVRDCGVSGISLGDTVGAANPVAVTRLIEAVRGSVGDLRPHPWDSKSDGVVINCHFHDTRGVALANVLSAMDSGVAYFDASVGGLGGCPYAPGAAGNLATEELVWMAESMGISTGVDLELLLAVARLAEEIVGRPLKSRLLEAGPSWKKA